MPAYKSSVQIDFGYRKIQVISGSAFISLPKTWIKTRHLMKGDGVSIMLRDDGILEVSPIKDGDSVDGS